MDYEKNNEALDIVKRMVADGQVSQEVAEKYFPELEESEDERVRKKVIDVLKLNVRGAKSQMQASRGVDRTFEVYACNKVLAWLEKQGEKKPVTDFSDLRIWKYIVDAVLTEKEGIGQYLDSPFTKEVAKKLQKRFGDIDQKSNELPNGDDYGIDSLWHAQRILEKTLGKVEGYQTDDGILEHECAISAVKKLYEQKPAWGEEDERIINSCIYCFEQDLKELKNDKVGHSEIISDLEEGYKEKIDFLKDLKDRVQPQTTWKPSDAQMDSIDCAVWKMKESACYDSELVSLFNDLKKLREE